jgi:hypothetical protein
MARKTWKVVRGCPTIELRNYALHFTCANRDTGIQDITDDNTGGLRVDTGVSNKRADEIRETEDRSQAASRSIFLRFRS